MPRPERIEDQEISPAVDSVPITIPNDEKGKQPMIESSMAPSNIQPSSADTGNP